jgi:hypothetical protein
VKHLKVVENRLVRTAYLQLSIDVQVDVKVIDRFIEPRHGLYFFSIQRLDLQFIQLWTTADAQYTQSVSGSPNLAS